MLLFGSCSSECDIVFTIEIQFLSVPNGALKSPIFIILSISTNFNEICNTMGIVSNKYNVVFLLSMPLKCDVSLPLM